MATAPCSSFTGTDDTACGHYGFCKKSASSTTCESKKCSATVNASGVSTAKSDSDC